MGTRPQKSRTTAKTNRVMVEFISGRAISKSSLICVFFIATKGKEKANKKITPSNVIILSRSYFGVFGKRVRNYILITI